MEVFDELKTAAAGRWPEPLRALESSLDRLDFGAASTHLATIESQLAREES
jgi:hypothetical protein